MAPSQLHVVALACSFFSAVAGSSFTIDYEHNTFLKDGAPFRYISGSFHYSRVPPYYWKDRLSKMYAAGLSAVQTYVPWNFHEPTPGVYVFDGDRDVFQFIRTAQDVGLLVILRPGPYICAEWEMGGFPSWLLTIDPSMALRSSDVTYLYYVDRWLSVLLSQMKPLLYENGGPIITVQVENEYGFYGCDKGYLSHLEQLFRGLLGPDAVLFTTDPPSVVKCGSLPNSTVYATVDFGISSDPVQSFNAQREVEPQGPLVNSEFYTGWLDFWGQPHQRVNSTLFANALDAVLKLGANVNMYMFEGGTNFAFWNGADTSDTFDPEPTSYDYDAPLTEAGDPWEKYMMIREVISQYQPVPPYVPPPTPKTAYGQVAMTDYAWLLDTPGMITKNATSIAPLTMEALEQSFGHVMYRSTLPPCPSGSTLSVLGLHDRGVVYIGGVFQGIVVRTKAYVSNVSIIVGPLMESSEIVIVVENMGRINFGSMINEGKGILYGVELNGDPILNWVSQAIPLNDTTRITFQNLNNGILSTAFFRGFFSAGALPNDTFLSLPGWNKGQAFMNGFNLGRYWPTAGPQKTLYVPASTLKPAPYMNELILFEIDHAPCSPPYSSCFVEFVSIPDIG